MGEDLVGRDRELAILGSCLRDARQGRPLLVLCRGEPGVGKTRLAINFGRHRPRGRVSVRLGGWTSQSPGAPPYWCWWHMLRRLGEAIDLGYARP